MSTELIVYVEVTDTFNGEANYSWVRRDEIRGLENKSDLAIVRHVKKLIGWAGVRCKTDKYVDCIEIRPNGLHQVCFITWHTVGRP